MQFKTEPAHSLIVADSPKASTHRLDRQCDDDGHITIAGKPLFCLTENGLAPTVLDKDYARSDGICF